ncbi:A1pp-domain-containing protein [Aulographum hederae CBS 113979]|uniref:A1pp-domain-containing protein n=1 Tax=Aulographum hederae CBS 113979 TaxID=1176131 RepID=A0A6G1GYW4_9PEZI|nr:A1pp-domain-containing protein [Aulographum hederae CBS 113979]
MADIRIGTETCLQAFAALKAWLLEGDAHFQEKLPLSALEDELGRFRVWCGNIGALQKGHSSLDYRLRESPLTQTNVLKLLRELKEALSQATAIVSKERLPYEEQSVSVEASDADADDSSDDNSDIDLPKSELEQRALDIVDIIDNLYRASVKIRSPVLKIRSLKAKSFKQIDKETGVDVFSAYTAFDQRFVEDVVEELRQTRIAPTDETSDEYLVQRLSRAVTKRRKQFKYWKKHRDKLAAPLQSEIAIDNAPAGPQLPEDPLEVPGPSVGDIAERAHIIAPKVTSDFGKTLISGTEATAFHRTLDDAVDSKTVTSIATTARDLDGRGVELPPPPKDADGERDFECPYCFVICPARHGRERAWRTHLLQDLSPYVCTYRDCSDPDQLYRSRREWNDHEESVHRRLWRCPMHVDAVYRSANAMQEHLVQDHTGITQSQIQDIVAMAQVSSTDTRETCPICFASSDSTGPFLVHLASHLERIATFALPKNVELKDEGSHASAHAAHGWSGSSSHDSRKWPFGDNDDLQFSDRGLERDSSSDTAQANWTEPPAETLAIEHDETELTEDLGTSDEEMTSQADSLEDEDLSGDSPRANQHPSEIRLFDILTIADLYLSGFLKPQSSSQDKSPLATHVYNHKISYLKHDMTDLAIDVIVNAANETLLGGGGLDGRIHSRAGSQLLRECRRFNGCPMGEVRITSAGKLPCRRVIHAVGPECWRVTKDRRKSLLKSCYTGALELAVANGLRSIAFPPISTGHNEYPQQEAAQIAIEAVLGFLRGPDGEKMDRVIFCAINSLPERVYMQMLPRYFVTHEDDEAPSSFSAAAADVLSDDSVKETDSLGLDSAHGKGIFESPDVVTTSFLDNTISHLYERGKLPLPQQTARSPPRRLLNDKVSLAYGSITKLKVDAIVNGSNERVDVNPKATSLNSRIIQAGGPGLIEAYNILPRSTIGHPRMTDGFELPCKKVLHVARPSYHWTRRAETDPLLRSCYRNCLVKAVEEGLKSIAFPSLSTGGLGYPVVRAAEIATEEIRNFLETEEGAQIDHVVICVFKNTSYKAYLQTLPKCFPPVPLKHKQDLATPSGSSQAVDRDDQPRLKHQQDLAELSGPSAAAGQSDHPRLKHEVDLATGEYEFNNPPLPPVVPSMNPTISRDPEQSPGEADSPIDLPQVPTHVQPQESDNLSSQSMAPSTNEEGIRYPNQLLYPIDELVELPEVPSAIPSRHINDPPPPAVAPSTEQRTGQPAAQSLGETDEPVVQPEAATEDPSAEKGSVQSEESPTPSIWNCCACYARPMISKNCLICFHEQCKSCPPSVAPESGRSPAVWLLRLWVAGIGMPTRADMRAAREIGRKGMSHEEELRPIYCKIHRKHIDVDTLTFFNEPWEFGTDDQAYIIITRQMSEKETDILFEHTKLLRKARADELLRDTMANVAIIQNVGSVHIAQDDPETHRFIIGGLDSWDKSGVAPPVILTESDHGSSCLQKAGCEVHWSESHFWYLEVFEEGTGIWLHGRRLLPPDDEVPISDQLNSGDILQIGREKAGDGAKGDEADEPCFILRVECNNLSKSDGAVFREAQRRELKTMGMGIDSWRVQQKTDPRKLVLKQDL